MFDASNGRHFGPKSGNQAREAERGLESQSKVAQFADALNVLMWKIEPDRCLEIPASLKSDPRCDTFHGDMSAWSDSMRLPFSCLLPGNAIMDLAVAFASSGRELSTITILDRFPGALNP